VAAERLKILALDGGGIRGVISARVLVEIEERTGRPTAQLFDLIAGTSTGGIIALGVTAPGAERKPRYAAADIVELYAEHGARIFSRSVWHRTRAFGNALEEKFSARELEQVLDDYFGETKLSDALVDVLVTAYEIEVRAPWFFRSRLAREKPAEYDFPMKNVARATSAAPTYFEPLRLETGGASPDYWTLVDGGVFANNPAMCAVAEGFVAYAARDVVVLSLGTGAQTRRIPYEEAKDWGLLGWARPILNVVFDGVSDTVHYQVRQVCKTTEGVERYLRLDPRLDIGNDDLDDASETNIHALKLQAERLIDERGDDLDRFCSLLAA
jgi:patatin-like phospholipase/acyl hydrolase